MVKSVPREFFDNYQKDYHNTKATYLKALLENVNEEKFNHFWEKIDFKGVENLERTIRIDLRQTYFHAIETFFELLFALDPSLKKNRYSENVLLTLTKSQGKETYSRIRDIASNESKLDFLDNTISHNNENISIIHYLIYPQILPSSSFFIKNSVSILDSLSAVKMGIKLLAQDFVNREEYNAYKHGLRLISKTKKMILASNIENGIFEELDMKNSMTFYLLDKKNSEIREITKILDSERDYLMTRLCSNLIHCLINNRRFYFSGKDVEKTFPQIEIYFFGEKEIKECSKTNVSIKHLVKTYKVDLSTDIANTSNPTLL